MKNPSEHHLYRPLLDAVLEEAAPLEFREALLARTVLAARRHRRVRQWSRSAAAVAVILGGPLALWTFTRPQEKPPGVKPPLVQMVSSQPLSPGQVISTRQGATPVIATSGQAVRRVETTSAAPPCKLLTDEQLLALFAGQSPALVRHDTSAAELILAAPVDEGDGNGR
jgi:hypothetical protein